MFVFSFSQDVYVMYERCLDPALSVRKQALSSLTALTLDQPHCTMLHTYVLRYVYACTIVHVEKKECVSTDRNASVVRNKTGARWPSSHMSLRLL